MMVAARVWRMLAGSPGFLTRYLLWRARFTARGQVRSVRSGMSSSAISVRWSGSLAAQSSGGNVRRPGGGAADQTQGLGERDAVGVQVGGRGRLRDQRADRVVHDQVGDRIGRTARWFRGGTPFPVRPSSEPRGPVSEHVALR